MRKILISLNSVLLIYLTGIMMVIIQGPATGAVLAICALLLLTGTLGFVLAKHFKQKRFFSLETLYSFLVFIFFVIIGLDGFSLSLNQNLNGDLPGFRIFFSLAGVLLIGLFFVYSKSSLETADSAGLNKQRKVLLAALLLSCLLAITGLLGFFGMLPLSPQLTFHSWVFLLIFFCLFSIGLLFFKTPQSRSEKQKLLLLSLLMLAYWVLRWHFPEVFPHGLASFIVFYGFPVLVLLPLSIFLNRQFRFYTIFILYTILMGNYFLFSDLNFNYLSKIGNTACIDFDKASEYKVVTDPGIAVDKLFEEAAAEELSLIRESWKHKDFTAREVKIETLETGIKGDSLTVVSHWVGGNKHYGLVYLPSGVNPFTAPILLLLPGKGGYYDVFKANLLKKEMAQNLECDEILQQYMMIMPSYRGNVVQGDSFCYRSHGYSGDTWLGAAEDAIMFLEAVKSIYGREDEAKVMGLGASRGATVALIAGALTDRIDYVVSISTHATFHNLKAYQQFPLHNSYPMAFYTPASSPENIRQKIIASSPLYFAEHLPDFEIHQGTDDPLTTVMHAKLLKAKMQGIEGGNAPYHQFYFYEGKGHYNKTILCKTLTDFLSR